MRIRRFKRQVASWATLLLASLACARRTAGNDPQSPRSTVGSTAHAADSAVAARRFVQEFYDWYTALAADSNLHHAPYWNVLDRRGDDLDLHLATALRGDSVASDGLNPSRELLDYDPFLNSQDPCARYEAADVHSVGHAYRVAMRPVCANPTAQRYQDDSRVTVSVTAEGGRWKIENIFYGNADLRSILCQFAKADTKPDRRPATCE